jgi:Cu(I)/Ag(I) efflux system membrane protein CusA/SilA
MAQLADISIRKGPAGIKSENARLSAWVYVDLRGIDIGSYVEKAKAIVYRDVELPTGYSMVWSGQYEYMEKARKTLNIIVPVTLVIIFLLLYFHFNNIVESAIVMASLPFAVVGGVWLLYLLEYNLSVAVVVGFIALAGLAAETGVVMLVYLDTSYRNRARAGKMRSAKDLEGAIMEGAAERVRPKLMTVATTLMALMPIMWGTQTGSEVMKRIAAPMVGGLISSTILTLIIIPVVYDIWKRWELRKTLLLQPVIAEKKAREVTDEGD